MKIDKNAYRESLLSSVTPSTAIAKLAIPATLALLAKAVYNITDTAYIGLLKDENALAAIGVTLPLLLIFVSIENIFAAGAAVLIGRQLGAGDKNGANVTVSTIVGVSILLGALLCAVGMVFMNPLLRSFGASEAVLPLARDYAFWMFIAAVANIPAQSLNCAARAESSVKISSIAIITGAALNVILDPVFMFRFGFNMGVAGASLATTVSQFVTAVILFGYYLSGKSMVKLKFKCFKPSIALLKSVVVVGIPSAVFQICLAVSTSLNNRAAVGLPDADLVIAAYGVVQRLALVGHYVIMGFMEGYQPVAAYSIGAKNEERFHESESFALKGTILLTALVEVTYVLLSKPLILLFNQNPAVVGYGVALLISQVALYPAFGVCYHMTITFQAIGSSKHGLLMSTLRQGLLYIPFILLLPSFLGTKGLYLAQPVTDVLTLVVCLLLHKTMKRVATERMKRTVIRNMETAG